MKPESKAAKIINLAKQLFIQNFTYSWPTSLDSKSVEEECKHCTKACIHAAKTFYKTIEEESNDNQI